MTWLAQVRHVLAKDVRETWWPLLLFALLLAAATARAVWWLPPLDELALALLLVVVVGAVFLVADAVQADSPTRTDAYWAIHPLRPSAVAAAKVALALLLVVAGAAGQAAGAAAYGLAAADLWWLALRSAVAFGAWLVAALLVAAAVRDLRGFAFTMLAVVIVPMAAMMAILFVAVSRSQGRGAAPPQVHIPAIVGPIAVAAAIGLLFWLYRSRDARPATRIAALLLAGLVLLTRSQTAHLLASPPAASLSAPGTAPAMTLGLADRGIGGDADLLHLSVAAAGLSADSRLWLQGGTATVTLRDGTRLRLLVSPVEVVRRRTLVPQVQGVRWLEGAEGGPAHSSVPLPLSLAEARALAASPVARVELASQAVLHVARPVATLPLEAGAGVTAGGLRVRVEAWSLEPGGPGLRIRTSQLRAPSSAVGIRVASPSSTTRGVHAALVNRERGEGLPLWGHESSESFDVLVVPGAELWSGRTRLGPAMDVPTRSGETRATTILGSDPAWLRGASLVVADERPVASYPVRLTFVVPDSAATPGSS